VATVLCVFGSMTFPDGSVTGLARAGLWSNVVVLAVVAGMGRWGGGGGRARRWVCGMASGVVHRVTSGVVPVAARLVGWNVRSRRLLLTKKTIACSQCEQVIPVTWNSVVVITTSLVDTPPGYQYRK